LLSLAAVVDHLAAAVLVASKLQQALPFLDLLR
jgi:hypothetical protein